MRELQTRTTALTWLTWLIIEMFKAIWRKQRNKVSNTAWALIENTEIDNIALPCSAWFTERLNQRDRDYTIENTGFDGSPKKVCNVVKPMPINQIMVDYGWLWLITGIVTINANQPINQSGNW